MWDRARYVRQGLNAALLLVGGGLGLAAYLGRPDLRRTIAIVGVLAAGAAMNLVGLCRRQLALRAWLRVLAALVGLAVLAGVLATRETAVDTLASLSRPRPAAENLAARQYLSQVVRSCTWLALSLVYALLSVAALPPERAAARTDNCSPVPPIS